VAGEIDTAATEELAAELQGAVIASRGRLILDLSAADFLDAGGLWSLSRADADGWLLPIGGHDPDWGRC
jgi:anti-anti-sigma regulatory factor